ncbi:MAG: hypothetical protein QXI19_11740 [Candidatus Caldarchaeum sp.]
MEREGLIIVELLRRGGAQMIYDRMREDDLIAIMGYENTMFGSDSSVRHQDPAVKPHPRGYGTFPRVLGHYVRERGTLKLEQAVFKMSYLPAKVFGLKGRGGFGSAILRTWSFLMRKE